MQDPHSKKQPECTITGDDWRRALAAARLRRKGAKNRPLALHVNASGSFRGAFSGESP